MTGPLDGLRVIDCSRGMAGTRATGLLADYGADVTWVEPPGGDPFRVELATAYAYSNRGKRTVELDLQSAAGRDAVFELLAGADVFVESWRPGVCDRLGLGWADLHERFPRLVGASISGFGRTGVHRDRPGYEALVQATVGAMGEQVGYRLGPIYGGVPFASMGAAYLCALGVFGAVYRRGIDGHGRLVETSLLDGALAYMAMMWGDSDDADSNPPIAAGAGRLVARTFSCADGEYIGVHTGAVGAFGRLMGVLGLDGLVSSSATGVDMGDPLTPAELEIVQDRIPEIFATQPRSFWLERLVAADICAIPALHPTEVFDEEQARWNDMVVTIEDPVLGPVEQVGRPIKFPEIDRRPGTDAPADGEHDDRGDDVGSTVPRDEQAIAMKPLLDGVRIVDFGAYFAGPYSSRLLADLGADVVKVEPIVGDQLRGLERPFIEAQAGKRSLAIDLKDPAARPALEGLLRWADVVHHNMRPGAAERLGIGHAQVAELNPAAIYLHAPGWGNSGPNHMRQSFEPLMSGFVGVSYESGGRFNPPTLPMCNADPGNALLGAIAILMGLVNRQRTGVGLYVENPQLNAAMAHLAHIVRRADGSREVIGAGRLDPVQLGISPLDGLYPTGDGWVCVVAIQDDEIAALGRVIGHDILADPRFGSAAARGQHDAELRELIGGALGKWTNADTVAVLDGAGVPVAVPIEGDNSKAFLRDAEQQRTRRVAEAQHPTRGRVRWVGKLVRVSECTIPTDRAAPGLGEHTVDMLRTLGHDDHDIADLAARGAIRLPTH